MKKLNLIFCSFLIASLLVFGSFVIQAHADDNYPDDLIDIDLYFEETEVDLDIRRFQVSNSTKVGVEVKKLQLTVENTSDGQDQREAILTGFQNGVEVYYEIRMVFDLPGNGRSRFAFPPFTPIVAGDINWTVEIDDDSADIDIATATTRVR